MKNPKVGAFDEIFSKSATSSPLAARTACDRVQLVSQVLVVSENRDPQWQFILQSCPQPNFWWRYMVFSTLRACSCLEACWLQASIFFSWHLHMKQTESWEVHLDIACSMPYMQISAPSLRRRGSFSSDRSKEGQMRCSALESREVSCTRSLDLKKRKTFRLSSKPIGIHTWLTCSFKSFSVVSKSFTQTPFTAKCLNFIRFQHEFSLSGFCTLGTEANLSVKSLHIFRQHSELAVDLGDCCRFPLWCFFNDSKRKKAQSRMTLRRLSLRT